LRELERHGYLCRTRERTATGRIVTRTVSRNRPGHHAAREPASPRPAQRTAEEKPPRRRSLPAVPRPAIPAPDLLRAAVDVLAGLRRHDPRLLLSATDAEHLAPGVAAWLEREVTPTAVRHALTADLPDALIRPAAFLAHRLAAQLPPPPPFRPRTGPPPVRHPLQNCDGCDRAFRAPAPGHCPGCRPEVPMRTGTK
jgi:hypothetical protein